jgi:thermostable 8-oxoguanine DNA glycosylase
MVNPESVTNFYRNDIELQEYFLFCIIVAGKTAFIQAQKLEQFLKPAWLKGMTPFEYIEWLDSENKLDIMIREAKLGQYKRITEIFRRAIKLDLRKVTVEQLEKIPGIGPKTSRFFVLHSRRNQNYAVLDTHILRWLNEAIGVDTPKATPQSRSSYKKLEKIFLEQCYSRGITPEELDLSIWNERARRTVA